MAKQRRKRGEPPDSDFKVRVRWQFYEPLQTLKRRRVTEVIDEVNRAVRELLEREGLWPPPAPPGDG